MKKNSLLVFNIFLIYFSLFSINVNASLTFTEIMSNPFGNEANREWIELFNYGNETINITGWKLQDGTTIRSITLYNVITGTYLIEPYSFVILARNPENFSIEYNYTENVFQSSFTLTNTGKELILYDNKDNIIDSVFYANIAKEGYTIELKNITLDNYLMENWQQANYLGNPGELPFSISLSYENNYENNNQTTQNNTEAEQTNNNQTSEMNTNNTNENNEQQNPNENNNEEQIPNQVPEFSTYGLILALTFVIAMFFKSRH